VRGMLTTIEGIKFTALQCAHSSGLLNPETGVSIWVGPAVGYMVKLENAFRIYAMGDTGLFSEMKFIGEYYQPDVVLVPIASSGFVMDAEQASYALAYIIKPRYLIPFYDFPEPSEAEDPQGALNFLIHSRRVSLQSERQNVSSDLGKEILKPKLSDSFLD